MKLLIVEDEILAARRIRKMVEELDKTLVVDAVTDSIESTVQWLNAHQHPDLILMDIELADGQSFEIFNRVDVKSTIIFTTAYDEFAIRAFKVNSIDYLLKPIDVNELKNAVDKFKSLALQRDNNKGKIDIDTLLSALRNQDSPFYKQRFLVRQGQRFIPLDITEIAYFYTEDKISFIKTFSDQRFVVDHSLDELEQLLDPVLFFRANRQFIITPASLEAIHNHFNGKLKVIIKPAIVDELFVSRERAADFKKWLGES